MNTPTPVRTESRNCFGISYFSTEEEAEAFARIVVEQGQTYNGGFYHGLPCGRSKALDRPDLGQFAVTTA